jgi:hypothetical protein
MNHLSRHWNKHMLTIVQNALYNRQLNGLLLLMKDLSLTNWSPFPSFILGLDATNNAAKPDCIDSTGDNGSLYDSHSSGKLIVI